MKNTVGIGLIFLVIALGAVFYLNRRKIQKVVPPPKIVFTGEIPTVENEKSAIGNKENPRARRAYEQHMLVDPKTGSLPADIRYREVRYAERIKSRLGKRGLRSNEIQATDWNSVGPYNIGGRTRAIAIDHIDEKMVLAGGVSGGVWRSEDEGRTWTETTVPSSIHSVTCIGQDKRVGRTNIWYYGSGEFTSNSAGKKGAPFRGDGVFKSTDNGLSWKQLFSTSEGVPNQYNSQFQYIWKVLPNPRNLNQDEVFLAAVGAIFRSVNGGESWTPVLGRKAVSTPDTNLNNANLSSYTDIIQTSDGVFYAVLSESALSGSSPDKGVYRSIDGVTWVEITPFSWPEFYNRSVIAVSESEPREVFFSVNTEREMLWKYTYLFGSGAGSGGSWTDLSENIPAFGGEVGDYDSQNSYNMVLAVHPQKKNLVFLGGTNLYRSDDGFSSAQNTVWIGGYDTANNVQVYKNHFVDQHALAFFPSDPDRMFSSNDGGVFSTEDNTAQFVSWAPKNYGFVTTQFYTVGLNEFGGKGVIIGGLQDNGSLIAKTPTSKSSWENLLRGDGGYCAVTKDELYYYASFQFGKIYRFTLDKNLQPTTFARVDPSGSGGEEKLLFVNPFVLAPENQNIMYFSGGDVIWRNGNISQTPLFENYPAGTNWEQMLDTEISSGVITALKATYNPSGILYYGTAGGEVYKIINAKEKNYTTEEITSSLFPENAYVSSIAVDRKDSKNLVVSFSNYNVISVFYSSDGGETFENISGNLEENPDGSGSGPSVRWVELVSKNQGPSQLFAATSTGIYSAREIDGNNTVWEPEGAETVGNVVTCMIKYFSGDGTIVAATHGNGMYESKLSDVWKTEIEMNTEEFGLAQVFPNPFQDNINISFYIPEDGMVRVKIYSAVGQLITTPLWAEQFKGKNIVTWNGQNAIGDRVASGTYICTLEYGDKQIGAKLVYLP